MKEQEQDQAEQLREDEDLRDARAAVPDPRTAVFDWVELATPNWEELTELAHMDFQYTDFPKQDFPDFGTGDNTDQNLCTFADNDSPSCVGSYLMGSRAVKGALT